MLNYLIEYILFLKDSRELSNKQTNILLGKIRDAMANKINGEKSNFQMI